MYKLVGFLMIGMSLLTMAVVLQVWVGMGGLHPVSIFLIITVFTFGILMLLPPKKKNGKVVSFEETEELVSDEEIEAELLKTNSK